MAVRRAIAAGVRCIEHGQLVDDETAALMAETGTLWSLQPVFDDEEAIPFTDPVSRQKQIAVSEGTAQAYELAKKHGIAVAFGSDVLFDPSLALRQGKLLAKLGRFHTAFDVLRMATSGTARYLEACGSRKPHPAALGVIAPGAWADMILVDVAARTPIRDGGCEGFQHLEFAAPLTTFTLHLSAIPLPRVLWL